MRAVAPDPALPAAAALRRAALLELDDAQAALRRGDARGVHQARKGSKRLRALGRLLRDLPLPASAGRDARKINSLLRQTAQALAAPREAAVALETFRRLKRPGGIPVADWRRLGQSLRRRAQVGQKAPARALAAAGAALGQVRELLAALPDAPLKPADLRRGLRKSRKRARKAFRHALPGDSEALHEWRKRAKRLEAVQALLEPLLQEPAVAPRRLEELTDVLGLHHDLQLLPLRPGLSRQQREWLAQAARAPAAALERQARRRGARLFG